MDTLEVKCNFQSKTQVMSSGFFFLQNADSVENFSEKMKKKILCYLSRHLSSRRDLSPDEKRMYPASCITCFKKCSALKRNDLFWNMEKAYVFRVEITASLLIVWYTSTIFCLLVTLDTQMLIDNWRSTSICGGRQVQIHLSIQLIHDSHLGIAKLRALRAQHVL